jgi:hypothetical protein
MHPPARQRVSAEQLSTVAATNLRAKLSFDERGPARRSLAPRGRRPGVSSYRVFMTIVFICVVLVDEWFDRSMSGSAIADVVGPVSVIVWAMTLLGSFGVGPVATIWNAMRR